MRNKLALTIAGLLVLDATIACAFAGCAIDFDRFDPTEAGAATVDGATATPEGASTVTTAIDDGAVTRGPVGDSAAPDAADATTTFDAVADAPATDADAGHTAAEASTEASAPASCSSCVSMGQSCDVDCATQAQACLFRCFNNTCRQTCMTTAQTCAAACPAVCTACAQDAGCSSTTCGD